MMLDDAWPYDLVAVKWLDAEAQAGWKSVSEEDDEEELVTSVGFLLKRGKILTLAATIYYNPDDGDHTTTNRMLIPKAMVKKITVLIPKNTLPLDLVAIVAPGGTA